MRISRLAHTALFALVLGAALAAPAAHADVYSFKKRTKAVGVDGYSVVYPTFALRGAPVDGFITRMHARIVNKRGRQVSVKRIMLHHVLFKTTAAHDDTYCPGSYERFYGTGEENQHLRLPPGYGYRVHARDRWKVNFMLMNHKPRHGKVYLEYRYTVDTDPNIVPVKPIWLGVVSCKGDPIFDVPGVKPAGSTYTKSKDWVMPTDGRLIAAAGHAHGGTKTLTLSQPGCGNRHLLESRPTYGRPDNVVYHVLPVLHEPGPIDLTWWGSRTGIPVRKGERIRVNALYDGEMPHTRAMGIMHIYLAPPGPPAGDCGPLPSDVSEVDEGRDGVPTAPKVRVPIIGLNEHGRAVPVDHPPGRLQRFLRQRVFVPVRGFDIAYRNLSVPAGTSVSWRFGGEVRHNVTLANGPEGFSSQHLHRGQRYRKRFTRPGTYRLFCSLHPLAMTQRVVVRP